MKVIKRDGRIVEYDSEKISIAIQKANKEVKGEVKSKGDDTKNMRNRQGFLIHWQYH